MIAALIAKMDVATVVGWRLQRRARGVIVVGLVSAKAKERHHQVWAS